MSITQLQTQTPNPQTIFTDTAVGVGVDAVKASSAVVYYIIVDNSANGGAATYVKLYNLASGSVVVGTTAPDEVIYVPAGKVVQHQFFTGANPGKTFGTALSAIAATTGGTAGNTPPSSSVVLTIAYT
jgi:hypothetical protein